MKKYFLNFIMRLLVALTFVLGGELMAYAEFNHKGFMQQWLIPFIVMVLGSALLDICIWQNKEDK